MPDHEKEFHDLLQGIQVGSEEAAKTFVERYGNALLRVIRRRLEPHLRRQFDSTDFLQDVFATFLCKPPQPGAFADANALFVFLTRLARNKVLGALRRQDRRKWNNQREHSLEGSAQAEARRVLGPEPTPSEVAVAQETWTGMLAGKTATHKKILKLLKQGHSPAEVVDLLDIHPKIVQRVLQRVRSRMES